MKIEIDRLTEAELIELNHRIVERLRFLHQMRAHGTMLNFSIGEHVTFTPDGRSPVTGMLVKYNKKTVTVVSEEGQRWNVSPTFLNRVKKEEKDITPKDNGTHQLKKSTE